jgi:hypothetical protein
MRACIDVRVHAQRDARCHAERARRRVEELQLGDGLDVEAGDVCRERRAHLGGGLARAREHDARGIAACAQDALELTARDDVEAGAEARQFVQHGEVAVRLDGEAHEVRMRCKRVVEGAETR